MASLVAKKKGNKLYYYVVESARVDGKPRIVHQAYLGTAEKLAEMVRDRTAPVPLAATTREFGLPAALWSAAQKTGVWDLLQSLWPPLAPALRPLTTSCWPPSTASASRAPKPKSPIGIVPPSSRRCGSFPRNALLRKLSGTLSNRSCPKARSHSPQPTIPSNKLNCVCWEYGKRNNW